jgi:Co/Zn/Cd efflux system component
MTAMAVWVGGSAIYKVWVGQLPEAPIMGAVGFAALIANISVAFVLFQFRGRDMNMQSVWLCSRNDALANLAVILAAGGVWVTTTRWPDLVVAGVICGLNASAGIQVLKALKTKGLGNASGPAEAR